MFKLRIYNKILVFISETILGLMILIENQYIRDNLFIMIFYVKQNILLIAIKKIKIQKNIALNNKKKYPSNSFWHRQITNFELLESKCLEQIQDNNRIFLKK